MEDYEPILFHKILGSNFVLFPDKHFKFYQMSFFDLMSNQDQFKFNVI